MEFKHGISIAVLRNDLNTNKVKAICNMLWFCCCLNIVAQNNDAQTLEATLENKTLNELLDITVSSLDSSDLTLHRLYRNYYLKKAKAENNHLEMARAYSFFVEWHDFEQDFKYCDSMIQISKDVKDKRYPANGYLFKAELLYGNQQFEESLDNFILANAWAERQLSKSLQLDAINGIAAIKNIWGLHGEALDIYRKHYYDLINSSDYQSEYYEDYMIMSSNLSLAYIRNNKPDSALVVSEQGMKMAHLNKDTLNYYDLVKVQATANYYLKNYSRAMDSLMRYIPQYSDMTLSDSYYMIGKMYEYYGNVPLTMVYFKKIDSLHQIINDPYPELQEVYHTLFQYASTLDDKELELYYIGKLIETDSILDRKYADIGFKVRNDYDIPKLKREKQQLNQKLNRNKTVIIMTLLIILLLMVMVLYYVIRQRRYKNRLKQLLERDDITIRPKQQDKTGLLHLDISTEIIDGILEKIKAFEQTKGYMSKNITLHTLSKEFNTNSTYLSNIINHEKQVNFSSYLKDLRITNAINTIKKNDQYLKYSISGLADEFGFNTAESFSKAFREKAGIKPSFFLDEMRKTDRS